jgi:hypothetical protein
LVGWIKLYPNNNKHSPNPNEKRQSKLLCFFDNFISSAADNETSRIEYTPIESKRTLLARIKACFDGFSEVATSASKSVFSI